MLPKQKNEQWIGQSCDCRCPTIPSKPFNVTGTQHGIQSSPAADTVITVMAQRRGLEFEPTHGVDAATAAPTTEGGYKCQGRSDTAAGGQRQNEVPSTKAYTEYSHEASGRTRNEQ